MGGGYGVCAGGGGGGGELVLLQMVSIQIWAVPFFCVLLSSLYTQCLVYPSNQLDVIN